MQISERMADVLGLDDRARDEDGEHYEGNIAARLVNVAEYGGSGLGGIELGFRGYEASTDFLTSIVSAVDDGETDTHEIADAAVPVYTATRLDAVRELGLTSESSEFASGETSIDQLAGFVLYEYGAMLADRLISEFEEWDEGDDEDGSEDGYG